MRKRPHTSWLRRPVFAGLCALLFAAFAAPRPGVAQGVDGPVPPGCRPVDATSPEWQAIGRRYATLARAMREKNFDAMVRLYAPTFEVREANAGGQPPLLTREQSIELQRNRMASVVETKLISNTILRLISCGDRVTATVLQQWYRIQMVGDRTVLVETAAVQDEEWQRTPQGWLRGNIGNLRSGAMLVDSKRNDPSRPYNRNAPPFEPFPLEPAVPGPVAAAHACRPGDPASPTWQAIGRGYARISDALRRRDLNAMLATMAPNIETRPGDGTVWNRERVAAYARAGIEQVRETRLTSNTILALRDCGDRATATVLQQWYRTQLFAGQVRRLETAAVQDEEWVSMPQGWLRGSVTNVRRGAWMVDGKRVNPDRPTDLDAPAWEPFPEG
jgi:hypothetical protein